MLKKLVLGLILVFSVSAVSFAQPTFDFSKMAASEKEKLSPIGDWLASGSSAMMWTTASAPTAFGFGVGVYVSGGSIPDISIPNIEVPKFAPNNLGIKVTAGTMGVEVAARYMPLVLGLKSMGFGAKYEFTKLLPLPPGTPLSLAGYFDYNKINFEADDNAFEFKNTSFGVLASGDLFVVTLYGRLGFETGSGSLSWKYNINNVKYPDGIDLSSNGMRAAVGIKLLGINLEAGTRAGTYFGAGYGFSF